MRPDTALYFTHLVAPSADLAIVAGHLWIEGHEPSITRVSMIKDGQWYHWVDLDDIVHAGLLRTRRQADEPRRFCLLGRRGLLRETTSGQAAVDTQIDLPHAYLLGLREVRGVLYAFGTQNQLHQQQADGTWQRIDAGLHRLLNDQVTDALYDLDGLDSGELLAAGMSGALWRGNGTHWQRLESPTPHAIRVVQTQADGQVLLAGDAGFAALGHPDTGWTVLDTQLPVERSLHRACRHDGATYLAAGNELLRWADGALTRVELPRDVPHIQTLSAVDGTLWLAGDAEVLRFDGRAWARWRSPENG